MYNIYVEYIILSLNFDSNKQQIQYYIVSQNDQKLILPSIKLLNDQLLIQARKKCISDHFNIKLDWLDDHLLDIQQDKDNIHIYYMCRIPIDTKIHNAQFIPITTTELLLPHIQKAIRYA